MVIPAKNYARKIGSMLLSAEIGLPQTQGHNNEAYVASWCQALRDHPSEILKAAADAEKIRQFMLDRERELTQTTEQTATQTQTQAVPEQTANRQEVNTPKKEQAQVKVQNRQNERPLPPRESKDRGMSM
jgi:hypothetical protein